MGSARSTVCLQRPGDFAAYRWRLLWNRRAALFACSVRATSRTTAGGSYGIVAQPRLPAASGRLRALPLAALIRSTRRLVCLQRSGDFAPYRLRLLWNRRGALFACSVRATSRPAACGSCGINAPPCLPAASGGLRRLPLAALVKAQSSGALQRRLLFFVDFFGGEEPAASSGDRAEDDARGDNFPRGGVFNAKIRSERAEHKREVEA